MNTKHEDTGNTIRKLREWQNRVKKTPIPEEEPRCTHNELHVEIHDYAVYNEGSKTYTRTESEYIEDGPADWSMEYGYRSEEVLYDVSCITCGETFYENGNDEMDDDDPMYEAVQDLIEEIQEGLTNG